MFNLQYRQKLFLYLSGIFMIFTVLVMLFQYNREKAYKRNQVEANLDNIAELTYNFIEKKGLESKGEYRELDSLYHYMPSDNVRVTIIDKRGKVLYDTEVSEPGNMENHLRRPEIILAQKEGTGSRIRESSTTGYEYFYYARSYRDMYVRVAAHYDAEIENFLHVEKVFLFYLLALFLIMWGIISLITKNLSNILLKLKELATKLSHGEEIEQEMRFPEGEFGEISKQILEIYDKLTVAKSRVEIEKNKLFSHLGALNEGIAFYKPDKTKVLRNKHFIQFINVISDKANISEEEVFEVGEFRKLNDFIELHIDPENPVKRSELPHYEEVIYKNKRTFNIDAIVFADRSFEIVIRDVTKLEKQKILKEQITANIAHELKTPITIILGYLDLLRNNNLDKADAKKYLENAYLQSERLSDLIQDISLLHKMSEARERFKFEMVNLNELIFEVKESFEMNLKERNIKVRIRLSKPILIRANRSLLISVFYNLFDNAINYGGEHIAIEVNNYLEDSNYFYFSFSNDGARIEERHFLRIFERFYRVDDDRSRIKGGTGLGLAIVKNAIQLHGGDITAGNRKEGGVEFLFTLSKALK